MKFLVFSDVDGTLLNEQHALDDSTIQVVNDLSQQDVGVILASARPVQAMQGIYQQLALNTPLVAYNGALIIQDGHILFSKNILTNLGIELIELVSARFPKISVNIYSYQDWFVFEKDAWVQQEEAITATKAQLLDYHQLHAENFIIHKLLFMGEEEEIQALEVFCNQEFAGAMDFTRSKATYLECVDNQVSKLAALKFLANYLAIPQQRCLAIGDNYNDLEMICYAGIGVAMKNSPLAVQQKADWVTESNRNAGFALAMRKLLTKMGTEES